jgi:hypothetical protein
MKRNWRASRAEGQKNTNYQMILLFEEDITAQSQKKPTFKEEDRN